ncbi:MAG: lipid kinase [Rhodospirillales bacterium]|nr:lipid kinase [Rhodospirillales bacterium]
METVHRPAGNGHRQALVVINRKGTRGTGTFEFGLKILEDADIEVSANFVRDPTRIPDIIRRHGADYDMVVIGGGDGTLSHAIEAVLACDRPLGIIPMGNANDLARTLAIPVNVRQACTIIAAGKTRRIDLGWVNGKHFFNVASMGISVSIAARLSGEAKRRWGVLGYLGHAWEALQKSTRFTAEIECDGEHHTFRSIQIAVGNGVHYGGGLTIVDDARIDDGCLDLYSLSPNSIWRLMTLFPVIKWGKHRMVDAIKLLRGSHIRIETDRPMRINVDGEVVSETPADFRVVPAAMTVFAPPG